MMLSYRILFRRAVVLAALVPAAAGAWQPASAPGLAALKTLQPGMWELRQRGATAPAQRICLGDPVALVQLRHASATCSRYVIENKPDRATVHYTCPGAGHGRTSIRVETRQLIRVESQGIAQNAPFNVAYEGRRVGSCG